MKRLSTTLCLLINVCLFSGCAILNTFEAPATLEPGNADAEVGLSIAPVVLQLDEDETEKLAAAVPGAILGHGYLSLRVGLMEAFEMKLSSGIGPKSFGAGAKYRLLAAPVFVSANAGISYRDFTFSFYGTTSTQTHVYYGGLLVGSEQIYGGLKLTKLYSRRRQDCDVCEVNVREYNRWVPQVSLGFRGEGSVSPMLEANLYVAPEIILTAGIGFRVNLSR